MTPGGWINLLLSVGFVTTLFIFCMWRVLRGSKGEAEHLAHIEPVEESELNQR